MDTTPQVTNNTKERQFELHIRDYTGRLTYNIKDDMIAFFHTEIPEALQGRGLGKILAEYALNYAKEHHLKILPYCPYVAKYVKEHPEWQSYVKHFQQ